MAARKKSLSAWLFSIFCVSAFIPPMSSATLNSEYRLLNDVFTNYSTTVRPLKNSTGAVNVQVTYFLSSIDNVNEKGQTITLSGWLHLEWTDEFLTWEPEQYDGVDMLIVPADKIWTPDLVFETGAKEKFFTTKLFWTRIASDGHVTWEPGGTMGLTCNYDLSYYPCDTQMCDIKLVTWANTGNKVFTFGDHIDNSNYKENGEWTLTHTRMSNTSYQEDGATYSEVHFYITIRRKPLYQFLNILLPIALLSVLNLLVFCIPPESGEKVSLSVTVLLAFSVWLLMMNGMMPSSSDYVPVMGAYITAFLISSSVSVFIAVMVLRIYALPKSHAVPPHIANMLRKVSGIKCRLNVCKKKVSPDSSSVEITRLPNLNASIDEKVFTSHQNSHQMEESRATLTERKNDKERKTSIVTWHQLADAMDMGSFMFFLFFFFILTLATLVALLQEFHSEK